jgi:hypothetical protein
VVCEPLAELGREKKSQKRQELDSHEVAGENPVVASVKRRCHCDLRSER